LTLFVEQHQPFKKVHYSMIRKTWSNSGKILALKKVKSGIRSLE